MAGSDVIRVGDKVDIILKQNIENADKAKKVPIQYKSQVLEVNENGRFELAMPIIKGKLIVLPLNVRYEITFNTQAGNTYKSIGVVTERYKKDGFYMMGIQLKTGLEKIQRREFFRHSYIMEFDFYILDIKHEHLKTAEEMRVELEEGQLAAPKCKGKTIDLSGGGMKFRSPYELDINGRIFVVLRLRNENMEKEFYLVANVIASRPVHNITEISYESRVRFVLEDPRIREEIIRFMFAEERKKRTISLNDKKENG